MRKPVLVVCAAASMVLLGGGLLTTAAMAETPPETPAVTGSDLPPNGAPPLPPDRPAPAATSAAPANSGTAAAPPSIATPAPPRGPAHPAGRSATDDEPADGDGAAAPRGADRAKPAARRAPVSADPGAPVQQQVLRLVNDHRRRGGCAELTLDRRLITAAARHASDMARRGYFDHSSPGGGRAGDRVTGAGYRWSRYGENIARGQGSAAEVVGDWMDSPAHRDNIMDCRLRQMGVGLAFDGDDTSYWVQDFATPQ